MQTALAAAQGCLGFAVRRSARAMAQYYDAALAPAGIKGTQFALLNAVFLLERPGMQSLAEALGMDRTTLTRNLRPLETQALLVLQAGTDRRERHVVLTAEGLATLTAAQRLWEQAHGRLVHGLGADRSRRLLDELRDLTALAKDV
ncbi:MAG: MarR family transcriptional regulator [Gammaproteobacteria bacterium]|jgi:DNA-binding MarR family transcriptional regulator|nr:MarR family transcriptional regulator [Gammaproteobacteria bacterium]